MSETNIYYVTNEDFILREIAGEAVLVPVGESTKKLNGMISLNETFAFIWRQFQQPNTIENVVSATKEYYEDNNDEIEKDIIKFVEESLQYGFLLKKEN